jgi:methionine-rich copper-binding protein CopC
VTDRKLTVACAVALLLALGAAQLVLAHATLEVAEPAPGGSVHAVPARVTARFSQEVDPDGSQLLVAAPDGSAADTGDGGADLHDPDRLSLSATLKPNLPNGVYTVSWLTTSAVDGDVQSGSYTFTVDPNAPETAGASPTASSSAPVVAPAPTQVAADVVGANPSDGNGGLGRGALIVGALAIVVALSVVAGLGGWRRRRP